MYTYSEVEDVCGCEVQGFSPEAYLYSAQRRL